MNISKRRILMKALFKSQFSCCLLVWMCRSRANNGKISRLHERCLRVIYSEKQLSFEMLLGKDGSVSVHNRNLQILATEICKIKNDLAPLIVTIPPIRTVYHGSKSISFLGLKIWNILPDRLKNADSVEAFKMQIKKWKPENCSCRLCKVYVQNVGFV